MTSPGRTSSPLAMADANKPPSLSGSKILTPSRPDLSRAEAIGLYRSGNFSTVPSPASGAHTLPAPPASIPRRPRAGTMPSTFTLGDNSAGGPSHAFHTNRTDVIRQLSGLTFGPASLSMPASGGTSPNPEIAGRNVAPLYFGGPKPSASSSDLATLKERVRSGTVALPPSNASSSFGRGVFSANFEPRSSSSKPNEEARSIKSDDSVFGADEHSAGGHVRTLFDYLGLDTDSPVSPPSVHATLPAHPQSAQYSSFQNLHAVRTMQQQDHIPSLNAMAGRMRASTVSGLPPRQPPLIRRPSPLASTGETTENGVPHDGKTNETSHYATVRGRLGTAIKSADPTAPEGHVLYSSSSASSAHPSRSPSSENSPERLIAHSHLVSASVASSSRPRASTLGGASLLVAPSMDVVGNTAARARAGTLAGMANSTLLAMSAAQNGNLSSSYVSDTALNANALGFVPGNGAEGGWPAISRPLTPESSQHVALTPTPTPPQQPSRSLWIGNLDPKTSAQELMSVFAVYGAIESLRLLPDKECGFVNFVSVHDAVHAKDDVLSRLGGQIPLRNGLTVVRIGYGKPESAPPTPASAIANGRSGTLPAAAGAGVGDALVQTSPTRALWIGSIPAQTTPSHLMEIFASYGPIESARVLTHKNCGFINFEHLDDAVRARKALNGREILGSEVGAVKIGYAKVPVKAPGTFSPTAALDEQNTLAANQQLAYETLARMRGASTVPLDQQIFSGSIQDYRSNLAMSFIPNGIYAFTSFNPAQANGLAVGSAHLPSFTEMQLLMRQMSGDDGSADSDELAVDHFQPPVAYYTSVPPPMNQEDPHRRMTMSEAPRLRDIRKRIDAGNMSPEELDQIATDLLEEIVLLSSDYIGNTIVQKLFERCSHNIKMLMLDRIAPHLAVIGCHKNGTWAAQKIIDCARNPEEIVLICQNLKPFSPPLLLDPLGNYVMQCTLRFGSPANDFVYDAMVDRCWEIGQGRFGARSMRTCLESEHVTRLQIKRVAIAIILNSIPLATNPNGALLLTWLLDSSSLVGRYRLLAPRLAPHLSHLCTHKLASLTVLRIINQKHDPDASTTIIDALFHSSRQVLEEVLGDQVHGISVIQKILASGYIDQAQKPVLSEKVKEVLLSLRVQHVPAYKKLAEELGIPVTPSSVQSQMLARTPPRPQVSTGWTTPQITPQMQPIGFSPYEQQFRGFASSLVPTAVQLAAIPGRGGNSPQFNSPQFNSIAMPTVANLSPLVRQMSPLPAGPPFPQIGSPDPFNALRYPQAFSFAPSAMSGQILTANASPVPQNGMLPQQPYTEFDATSQPSGMTIPANAYQ